MCGKDLSKLGLLLDRCEQGVVLVNESTISLFGERMDIIKPISLPRPGGVYPELVFLRAIFWLHALFHECGGRALRYCVRQTQFDDADGRCVRYMGELRLLRTYMAHNLDPSSPSDNVTLMGCRSWFKEVCRVEAPFEESHWILCIESLLAGACNLLDKIILFAKLISDADYDMLRGDLAIAIASEISPYSFDWVIRSVAEDLGRSDLNLDRFRAVNFSKWMDCLRGLSDGYDFAYEARRLIERSFLESPERPPVTGRDIIDVLGVTPGRQVEQLLQVCRRLFDEGVRDKDALLDGLRQHIVP